MQLEGRSCGLLKLSYKDIVLTFYFGNQPQFLL